MNAVLRSALQKAATVTFGAYSRDGFSESAPAPAADAPISVAVGFTGPRKGRVEVSIWRDALGNLAASMYDQDEPPPYSDQLDAIREVTNVITGNVLRALDPEKLFDLELPTLLRDNAVNHGTPAATADFGLGTGRVSVRLFMEN